MKFRFCICVLFLLAAGAAFAQAPSAWEKDSSGWINLLEDKSLKGWTRLPVPAGAAMAETSPWTYDAAAGVLICNGDKSGHEWLRYDREFSNLILHVEWRFTLTTAEARYNSGVYVRNSADADIWHQAQTGNRNGGFIFGGTLVQGAKQRLNLRDKVTDNREKPAGEWNVYEIRAEGPRVSLWVNGGVTCEWPQCEVPSGYVGLEAEGYRIEFRNVRLKRLP